MKFMEIMKPHEIYEIYEIYEIAANWDRVKVSLGAGLRLQRPTNFLPLKSMEIHEIYEIHGNP